MWFEGSVLTRRGGRLDTTVNDDLGPVFDRAQARGAKLIDEPHMNEKASSVEFSLYDPDGYALTVSQWKE